MSPGVSPDFFCALYTPRSSRTAFRARLAASQLFSVTRAPSPPGEQPLTALGVLWYNVFATNDAREELGGQPYGNQGRRYSGSLNDVTLNRGVERSSSYLRR